MTETAVRRRGHGEDAIYFDATKNRYVGKVLSNEKRLQVFSDGRRRPKPRGHRNGRVFHQLPTAMT